MRQLIESKTFTEADSRQFGNSASLSKIPGFVFEPGKIKKTFNTSHKCKFFVSGSLYIHYVTYNTYWSDVFCFPYRGIEKELNLCLNRLFTSNQTHRRHIYQIWKPASHTWNYQLSRKQKQQEGSRCLLLCQLPSCDMRWSSSSSWRAHMPWCPHRLTSLTVLLFGIRQMCIFFLWTTLTRYTPEEATFGLWRGAITTLTY